MKINKSIWNLFIVTIALLNLNKSVIIGKNEEDNNTFDRNLGGHLSDEFFENVLQDIEAKAGENKLNIEKNPSSEHKMEYLFEKNGDKDFGNIEVEKSGGKINISLHNEYETMQINSENLDYENQKETILDEFIKPFLDHLSEILENNLKVIFEHISNGMKNASVDSVQTDGKYNVAGVDIVNESEKKIDFKINVQGVGMEDGIEGFLEEAKNKSLAVKLFSKYFQSVFVLNVKTANYIEKECQKMMESMLTKLDNMISLNETDSDSSEKEVTNENLAESINKAFGKYEDSGMTVNADSETKFSIKKDETLLAEINIQDEEVGEVPVKGVTVKIEKMGKEFKNRFVGSSLYTITALADAFFAHIARITKIIMDNNNMDEYISAFASEQNSAEDDSGEKQRVLYKNSQKISMKQKI